MLNVIVASFVIQMDRADAQVCDEGIVDCIIDELLLVENAKAKTRGYAVVVFGFLVLRRSDRLKRVAFLLRRRGSWSRIDFRCRLVKPMI